MLRVVRQRYFVNQLHRNILFIVVKFFVLKNQGNATYLPINAEVRRLYGKYR